MMNPEEVYFAEQEFNRFEVVWNVFVYGFGLGFSISNNALT